jgi:hypothetical protein
LAIDARPARAGSQEFERSTDRVERSAKGATKANAGLTASFVSLKRAMFGIATVAGAIATGGLGILGKRMIDTAAGAEELEAKFGTVFKGVNEDAQEVAATMSTDLRRSIIDVKDAMASFQDTFVPLGFARGEALKLSGALAQLSFDLSSFYDKNQADVMRDLQSALVGQTDTVRKYGATILVAQVNEEAYRLGLARTGEELSEQAKILSRLSLLYSFTADAQGDLVRTADSFSNKLREMAGLVKDLSREFGERLIGYLQDMAERLGGMDRVMGLVRLGFEFFNATAVVTIGILEGLLTSLLRTIDAMGGAEKVAKDLARATDELSRNLSVVAAFVTLLEESFKSGFRTIALAVKAATAEILTDLQILFDFLTGPIREAFRALGDFKANVAGRFSVQIIPGTAGFGQIADALDDASLKATSFGDVLREEVARDWLTFVSQSEQSADRIKAALDTIEAGGANVFSTIVRGTPSNAGKFPLIPPVDPAAFGPPARGGLDFGSFGVGGGGGEEFEKRLAKGAAFRERREAIQNLTNAMVPFVAVMAKANVAIAEQASLLAPTRVGGVLQNLADDIRVASAGADGFLENTLINAEDSAADDYLNGLRATAELTASEIGEITDRVRELESIAERSRLGESIGGRIGLGLEQAIFQAEKLRDVFRAMITDIGRIIFNQLVTQRLAAGLGGLFAGAKGMVLNQGNLVAFAGGGVVGGPTLFPMANGRTGLMGEAGPEAIMPLKRGSDGKLGVEAAGGGAVVTMHIHGVRDADSFKRSERQIVAGLQTRLQRRP